MIKNVVLLLIFLCHCTSASAGFWSAVGECFTDPCNCGDSNSTKYETWNGVTYNRGKKNHLCPPWNKNGGRNNNTCLVREIDADGSSAPNFPDAGIAYYENICGEATPESTYFKPKIKVRGQQCNAFACWTTSNTLDWDGDCVVLAGGYGLPLHRMCARIALPRDDVNNIAADPNYHTGKHLNFEGAVGKTMAVHGKSSNYQLLSGLIPVLAGLSKVSENNDSKKIAKYNEENKEALNKSEKILNTIKEKLELAKKELNFQTLDNKYTPEQLDKIKLKAGITKESYAEILKPINLTDNQGNQIYTFEIQNGNYNGLVLKDNKKISNKPNEPIFAIKTSDGSFKRIDQNHNIIDDVLNIPKEYTPIKVQVFGQPDIHINNMGELEVTNVKQITADADVLAYGTGQNIENFNTVSYEKILVQEKTDILKTYPNLSENDIKQLSNSKVDSIDEKLRKLIPPELINQLEKVERQAEGFKGMGEGALAVLNLTGHMREALGDLVLTHGSEQFNLHYTQDMGKEWVLINPEGKISVIKGEEELIKTFNELKKFEVIDKHPKTGKVTNRQFLNMPPNPNWGWELDNGQYKIDNQQDGLKTLFDEIDNAKKSLNKGADAKQKDQLKELISEKLKLGILYITTPKKEETAKEAVARKNNLKTKKVNLQKLLDEYKQNYPVISKSNIQKLFDYLGKSLKNITSEIVKTTEKLGDTIELKLSGIITRWNENTKYHQK